MIPFPPKGKAAVFPSDRLLSADLLSPCRGVFSDYMIMPGCSSLTGHTVLSRKRFPGIPHKSQLSISRLYPFFHSFWNFRLSF